MATVTFTAVHPTTGETVTRSSGTMPYVAVVFGDGLTWHKTFAAARLAAKSSQHTWKSGRIGKVVLATPTAINGKIEADEFSGGWGDIPASAFTELVAAKNTPKDAPADDAKARRAAKARARRAAAKAAQAAQAAVAAKAAQAYEATNGKPDEERAAADDEVELVPAPKKVTKKQAFGALVHAAASAALEGELPEGMTRQDAEAQLRAWMQYIPNGGVAAAWKTA
jgi:hypothetical protein